MTDGDGRTRGGFPSTRHSVIERIREGDPDARRQAFGDLVESYWKPLYKHLRLTWRLDPEEARDLTQGFFADAFEKAWLERFEPDRARFRTFVRVCADRYVMNARQASARLKRGGANRTISLDFEGAEREVAAVRAAPGDDPEAFFRDEFVRALFERAVRALRAECEGSTRDTAFCLFERYDLAPDEAVSYAQLAAEHGLTTMQVTNQLARIRRRFRAHALDALRAVCASDEEFRREARDLFGMEVP
ncbi:MAG TPA: sigma-70 family RNA polymerase sigma factor [Vicinamibacterales bacterium]|nr:sigma-70 family RNA polymerase sigma factor [Vicinamibacterales bacterium]